MVTVHPEYVVDEKQNRKAVLLPAAEWDLIVGELEDLDAIRAYDAAQPNRGIGYHSKKQSAKCNRAAKRELFD